MNIVKGVVWKKSVSIIPYDRKSVRRVDRLEIKNEKSSIKWPVGEVFRIEIFGDRTNPLTCFLSPKGERMFAFALSRGSPASRANRRAD